eukprot:gene9168-16837_t
METVGSADDCVALMVADKAGVPDTDVLAETVEVAADDTDVLAETVEVAADDTDVLAEIVKVAADDTGVLAEIVKVAADDTGVLAETVEVASDDTGVLAEIVEVTTVDALEVLMAIDAIKARSSVNIYKRKVAANENRADILEAVSKNLVILWEKTRKVLQSTHF